MLSYTVLDLERAHSGCGCYPGVGYHWQIAVMCTRVLGGAWAGERDSAGREKDLKRE